MKNEERWLLNYNLLREYILEHHFLPGKKKVENRGLLNWWKYNKRLATDAQQEIKKTVEAYPQYREEILGMVNRFERTAKA